MAKHGPDYRSRHALQLSSSTRYNIQLSGFKKSDRNALADMADVLGARCLHSLSFDARCNIVVIKKPCRSEKFLCGLALGIPIVGRKYVEESHKAHRLLDPERFIWRPSQTSSDYPDWFVKAPLRAVEKRKKSNKKTLSTWICAVKVQDDSNATVYKRILSTGGARVVNIRLESVTSTRNVPSGLTHLFTEIFYRGPHMDTVARAGVHCVIADYIGDYLIKEEQPMAHHYIVPYCPIIELTDSPVSDDSPIVQADLDSDVEIVSSVVHHKTSRRSRQLFSSKPNTTSSSKRPKVSVSHSTAAISMKENDSSGQQQNSDRNGVKANIVLLDTPSPIRIRSSSSGQEKRLASETDGKHHLPKKLKNDNSGEKKEVIVELVDSPVLVQLRPLSPQQASNMREYVKKWVPKSSSVCSLQFPSDSPKASLVTSATSDTNVFPSKNVPAQLSSHDSLPKAASSSVSNTDKGETNVNKTPKTSGNESEITTPQSSSRIPEVSSSQKKYTKLLVLTPSKITRADPQSPSSSQLLFTPNKPTSPSTQPNLKKPSANSTKNRLPVRASPSSKFSSKSTPMKKKSTMPHGALLKYLTVTPCKQQSNPDTNLSEHNSLQHSVKNVVNMETSDSEFFEDIKPLPQSQPQEETTPSNSVLACVDQSHSSNVDALDPGGPIDGKPIDEDGIRKQDVADGTVSDREAMYQKHEQIVNINKTAAEEFIDLSDDFHVQELRQIPVVLYKQIEAYLESDYAHQVLEGVQMVDSCTSNIHYPTSRLLKPMYNLLLKTTEVRVANGIYDSLMSLLLINPPNKRVHDDETATPSKRLRKRRMRHIYMLSLAERPNFKQSFFVYLNTAVQTILKGGLPLEQESQVNSYSDSEEDDNDDTDEGSACSTPLTNGHVGPQSTESGSRDGKHGSRLFIDFMVTLLTMDFDAAKSPKDSMLHDICRGNAFSVNLVDSKDSKSMFELTGLLMNKQEIELGMKLMKLIGLLADMCKPADWFNPTDYPTAQLMHQVSDIVMNSSLSTGEDILFSSALPPWFAYLVIMSILENPSYYNCQLIDNQITHNPPSLRALISSYFFLVPSDDVGSPLSPSTSCKPQSKLLPPKLKRNHKGETPLHTACIKGNIQLVKQLLKDPNTDVNAADNAGWTPLHEACNHRHLDIVDLLLNHRSLHFYADGHGQVNLLATAGDDALTPLHDAVDVGALEVVKLLLKHGGRKLLAAESSRGTPLDVATCPKIRQLLEDALKSEDLPDASGSGEHNSRLKIVCPSPEVYLTRTCFCSREAIERYVTFCSCALSLHISAFPLSSTDRSIISSMSSHLQPFIDHIAWLNPDLQMKDFITDKLAVILFLSL